MRPGLSYCLLLFSSLAFAGGAWGFEAPLAEDAPPVEPEPDAAHFSAFEAPLTAAPPAATEASAPECTRLAGREMGRQVAKQEGSWGWGAAGAGTACASGMLGCFTLGPVLGAGCGGMGCLAATGAAYLVGGEAEAGSGGCFDTPEYASGYTEGYEQAIAKQNALYAFAGGVIGAVAAVPLSLTLFFTALLGGAAL